MLNKITILFISIFFLTGCVKQSTLVSVNVPIDEIEPEIVVSSPDNTNTNTKVNGVNAVGDNTEETISPVTVEIPNKLELDVDFAPQAPFGNWNELYEEACEEASMVIVAKYFAGELLDESVMEQEIEKLDSWEKARGYKIDLSVTQTANVLREYYGLTTKIVNEVTVDRIKYELSRGNLIIVPAAGRELENPYFRAPGPIYHMLVIKGYDNNEFITNEVGTKRGDGFKYKYQQLIDAVHDWDPSWYHSAVTNEQMESQPKRMIVVSK